MWEVIRIANKLGIDIGQNEIDRQEHTLGRLPYENKPSTLQDLEVGKRTEVDMLSGRCLESWRQFFGTIRSYSIDLKYCVTIQYLHSYTQKSIPDQLR